MVSSASTCSSLGDSVDSRIRSNATPSPMENKSVPQPSVDSNIPPSNQSFIEALASLSYAADVLSNASKAISSAVESLMLASSGSDCRNLLMHIGQPLSPRSRTEEWLDRDYSLNSRSKLETENTPASSFAQTNKAQQDQVIKTNGMPESPRGSSHMPHSQQQTSSDNQSDVSELKLMEPASALFQAGDQAPHRSDQVGVFTTLSGSQERDSQTNADGVALSPMVDHPLQHPSSPLSQRNGDSSGGHITEPEEAENQATNLSTRHRIIDLNAPSNASYSFTPIITQSQVQVTSDDEISSFSSEEPAQRRTRPWNFSQQYIVLEEVFDVIPLICSLANYRPHKNIICFVKDINIFQELETMIDRLVTKRMYMLVPGGPKGVKRDAARACDSPEGCLVFCSIWSTPLPEPIRNKEFDCIIHVGWVYNSDRYNEVIDTNGLRRATLILTQEEFDEEYLSQVELKQVGYDPCRATDSYNSLESNAKLSAMREQWKDELGGHYGTLCRCFEAWIKYHFSGPHQEAEWDAIDVVTKANTFAKKAFLHGSAKVAPRHPTCALKMP